MYFLWLRSRRPGQTDNHPTIHYLKPTCFVACNLLPTFMPPKRGSISCFPNSMWPGCPYDSDMIWAGLLSWVGWCLWCIPLLLLLLLKLNLPPPASKFRTGLVIVGLGWDRDLCGTSTSDAVITDEMGRPSPASHTIAEMNRLVMLHPKETLRAPLSFNGDLIIRLYVCGLAYKGDFHVLAPHHISSACPVFSSTYRSVRYNSHMYRWFLLPAAGALFPFSRKFKYTFSTQVSTGYKLQMPCGCQDSMEYIYFILPFRTIQ